MEELLLIRNKKTGEIANLNRGGDLHSDKDGHIIVHPGGSLKSYRYNSITELIENWEDYKEPEEIKINEIDVIIEAIGEYCQEHAYYNGDLEKIKILNNASKKFEAWKRLKDAGFWFTGFEETNRGCLGDFTIYCYMKPDYTRPYDDVKNDLDLLFGGEK